MSNGSLNSSLITSLWSDNESRIDYLGFGHLLAAIRFLVESDDLHPSTIGVFGDWGSGKSSLIQMATDSLDDTSIVVEFNGWQFENYDDAKAALLTTILNALASHKTFPTEAKELLYSLMRRVNWMRLLGMTAKGGIALSLGGPAALGLALGSDLKDFAKTAAEKATEFDQAALETLLKPESPGQDQYAQVRQFRQDFAELIGKTKASRLIVVIDDLDRCSPVTVVETLEAIKLFLAVKHTVFLIGADEQFVEEAIRTRYRSHTQEYLLDRQDLEGANRPTREIGRDYLEKIIQHPIRIPRLGIAETEGYLCLLLAESAGLDPDTADALRTRAINPDTSNPLGHRVTPESVDELLGDSEKKEAVQAAIRLGLQIAPLLGRSTHGNPRQIKRFLNSLSMRLHMARDREIQLDPLVLSKLMLLEFFRRRVFALLASHIVQEAGKPESLRKLEIGVMAETPPEQSSEIGNEGATKKSKKTTSVSKSTVHRSEEPSPLPDWAQTDLWILHWGKLTPSLQDIDLRPYVYFTRDSIDLVGISSRPLTEEQTETLSLLRAQSEARRNQGISKAKTLGPEEVAMLFDALMDEFIACSTRDDSVSSLRAAVNLTRAQPSLSGQLAQSLKAARPDIVAAEIASELMHLATASFQHHDLFRLILESWSQSKENGPLKAAAQAALHASKRTSA